MAALKGGVVAARGGRAHFLARTCGVLLPYAPSDPPWRAFMRHGSPAPLSPRVGPYFFRSVQLPYPCMGRIADMSGLPLPVGGGGSIYSLSMAIPPVPPPSGPGSCDTGSALNSPPSATIQTADGVFSSLVHLPHWIWTFVRSSGSAPPEWSLFFSPRRTACGKRMAALSSRHLSAPGQSSIVPARFCGRLGSSRYLLAETRNA